MMSFENVESFRFGQQRTDKSEDHYKHTESLQYFSPLQRNLTRWTLKFSMLGEQKTTSRNELYSWKQWLLVINVCFVFAYLKSSFAFQG